MTGATYRLAHTYSKGMSDAIDNKRILDFSLGITGDLGAQPLNGQEQ